MAKHINPYVAGAPVTDQRMFFGREDVFTWIEQNIGGQFSENMLVLHGQRRVGKTSVLKQLGNHISDNYIPVFFDFQGRTNTTINRFLYRLAREVVRTLSREHGIKIPQPDREAFERDAEHFAGTFLSQVREILGERNLVLVFDEFDTLEERTARDMLGQYLVPYFSRMVHGAEKLNFIFSIGSSGHKLEDMRAEYTDFFRASLYKRISFLDAANSRRLIIEPVREIMAYEDQAVERIIEVTSGHPYFTQLLCHELFARAQRTDDWLINLSDVEEVLPDVIERGTVNLKFVWDVASSTERYTLATLAEMGREASKEEILNLLRENKVRISGEEIGQALLELTSRDVLSKEHGFTVELLRLWLLENRPLKRVVEELAEKHPVAVRHTQIAEEYREQDQIEQALENYHSALAVAPNYNPAYLGIAEIYQETGRWLEAVEVYKKIIAIDSKESRAKIGLCESLVALGDAARDIEELLGAIVRYQEALGVDDAYIEARERLATIYLSQSKELVAKKKWKSAGESLLEAWNYIPKGIEIEGYPDPPLNIDQLEGVEELENAIAPLRKALSTMRAQLAREELARAVQLREGEQYSAALAKLERALAYEADLEEIQKEIKTTRDAEREEGGEKIYTSGKRALGAQRWGEAINTFQRYLELGPEDARREKKVKSWIEEARLQEELAERYAAAQQAIERGVTRRAMALLREIKDLEDNYRDVEQLLDEARSKWRRNLFSKAALWGIGIVLLGVLGWWLLKPATLTEMPISSDKMPVSGDETSVPEIDTANAVDAADPAIQIALDIIQNEEPTYQTSFDFWDFGEPVENASIENGKLIISSEESGQHPYINLNNLSSDTFAVEFELRILESSSDSGRCYYEATDNGGGESLRTILAGLSLSGKANLEHYVHPDKWPNIAWGRFEVLNSNTVTLIVLGEQISVSVNGQMAYSILDPDGSALYISHGLAAEANKCEFDNYKIWDLSEVDFSDTTTTLDPATKIALDIIQSEEPLYETNYDFWDFAYPQENASNARIENGKLIVSGGESQSTYVSQTDFHSDRFAVEYEVQILESSQQNGACLLNIDADNEYGVRTMFLPRGEVEVDHLEVDSYEMTIGYGKFDPSNPSTATLIVLDDQFSLFVDGQLAFTASDPEGSAVYTNISYEADAQMTCEFDNYKFWDLSDVDFESQDEAPTSIPVPLAWKRLTSAQFIKRDLVTAIVIDPADPDVWYAGTGGGGIYKSINGGISWLPIQNGLGRAGITTLLIDPNDPMILYASTSGGGGYKTIDGGQNWQSASRSIRLNERGPSDDDIVMDPQDSQHLFYLNSSGVYESKDGANSWEKLSLPSLIGDCGAPQRVRFSPVDSQTLLMLTGQPHDGCSGVFKSTDGGKTWASTELSTVGEFLVDLWIDNITGDYVYTYSGSTGAFYRSSDVGETWLEGKSRECDEIAFHPEDGATAYCGMYRGEVKRTTNGGQSWQEIGRTEIQEDIGSITLSPHDPNTILVGGDGLFFSPDSGYNWEERSNGLGAVHLNLHINPLKSSILYITEGYVGEGSLYRSMDSGSTWEFINDQGMGLAFDSDGQVLYRVWEGDGNSTAIMISHNEGDSWEVSPYLPSNIINIFSVKADPLVSGKIYANVMSSEGDPNQQYSSIDRGETWESSSHSFDSQVEFIDFGSNSYFVNAKAVDPQNPETIYAGTDGGAYISFNGGEHWAPINDGLLGGLVIYSIVVDEESNVYAATPLGIFKLEQQ